MRPPVVHFDFLRADDIRPYINSPSNTLKVSSLIRRVAVRLLDSTLPLGVNFHGFSLLLG